MQGAYVLFRDDHVMKLPYFIAIAGFVCALFAIGIPHLSALRVWLGVSTVLSLVYIIAALVLSLNDGKDHTTSLLQVMLVENMLFAEALLSVIFLFS